MNHGNVHLSRPDIAAAVQGRRPRPTHGRRDRGAAATLDQAHFWARVYGEIMVMEAAVLDWVEHLMAIQSPEARHEVEISNVPVIAAQLARFQRQQAVWQSRVIELQRAEA